MGDHRQPGRHPRHQGHCRHRPRQRHPAHRGQHLRHSLPVPAHRARGRHRGPLRDQVHWGTWCGHRRGDRRVWPVPIRQREFPGITEPHLRITTSCSGRTSGSTPIDEGSRESLRDIGAAMSPFNAFIMLLGLETLHPHVPSHRECTKSRRVSLRASGCGLGPIPDIPQQPVDRIGAEIRARGPERCSPSG